MNRSHTAESYLRLIERIRDVRPDIMMSGDFIVGFPEETEADFQATLDLVEQVNYGYAYSFKYSTRPGTPAASRPIDASLLEYSTLCRVFIRRWSAIQMLFTKNVANPITPNMTIKMPMDKKIRISMRVLCQDFIISFLFLTIIKINGVSGI